MITGGTMLFGAALFLIGPCTACGIEHDLNLVFVGIVLFGIGNGFMYIPLMAHMIDLAVEEYGFANDDVLSDTLSASFNFFAALGNLIGPIAGGILVDEWSFENMTTLQGSVFIIYSLIFAAVTYISCSCRRKMKVDLEKDFIPKLGRSRTSSNAS